MDIPKDLLALETAFWTGDADFYRKNLDAACLLAFPDMVGVMDREAIAATAKEGQRWRDLQIEPKGMVQPSSDVTVISYEAKGVRANGHPYAALVSTGYVKHAGAWKMMFHQQTPHEPAKAKTAAKAA